MTYSIILHTFVDFTYQFSNIVKKITLLLQKSISLRKKCRFCFILFFKRFNEDREGNKKRTKYSKTARILSLFVIAYLAQWWPVVLYTIWGYEAQPHIILVVVSILYKTPTANNSVFSHFLPFKILPQLLC